MSRLRISVFIIFIFFAGFLFSSGISTQAHGISTQAQGSCVLQSASWTGLASLTVVHVGVPAGLKVTGQGCSGLNVSFDIYEYDPLKNDYITTVSSRFAGNEANATYTFTNADFVKGGNEVIGENIIFKALVFNGLGNKIGTVTSSEIVLLNLTGGSGTGGGQVPPGGGQVPPGGGQVPGQPQIVPFEIPNPIAADSLVDLAKAIGKFLFQIAIPIAVIIIIYSGLLFLTSGGSKEKVAKARTALTYALVGLAIILIGQGFFTLIKSILNLGR